FFVPETDSVDKMQHLVDGIRSANGGQAPAPSGILGSSKTKRSGRYESERGAGPAGAAAAQGKGLFPGGAGGSGGRVPAGGVQMGERPDRAGPGAAAGAGRSAGHHHRLSADGAAPGSAGAGTGRVALFGG